MLKVISQQGKTETSMEEESLYIIVITSLHINEDKLGKHQELEALWINVRCQSQTWLIGCVYRPRDKHSFYTIFDDVLAKIWMKRKNIVILGDLNSDLLMKGKSKEDTYLGRRLLKILNPYGLKNVINQPTRIVEKSQTIIDLIITSSPEKITVKGVSHLGISDHSLVYANIRVRKERAQRVFKTVNSYKNVNSDKFRKEVESAPWGVCNVFDDIEDQVWTWEYLFKEISKDHISQKKINIKTKPLPWITSSIKKEQNKRYKLLSEFRQTKDKETWEKYKQTRNKVKKLLREAELSYWKQEFAKAETSKDFWKVVNKAQGKIKSKVIGTIVNKDGDILTSDKEKAESLNEYFTSIGQELTSEFSSDNRNNMNFIYRVSPTTTRITLSLDKVCVKLRNIKKKLEGRTKSQPMNLLQPVKCCLKDCTVYISEVF